MGSSWPCKRMSGIFQFIYNCSISSKSKPHHIMRGQESMPLEGGLLDAAHPAAVVGCKNKNVTKNIVKLLEKHCQLSSWGFCDYSHESNVEWCNGAFVTYYGHRSKLCRSKYVTGDGFTITNRMSTVGGIVIIGDVPYIMTVLHPFKKKTTIRS